jgi:hypothetical protein
MEDRYEPGMMTLSYDLGTALDGMGQFQWTVLAEPIGLAGGRTASVSLAQTHGSAALCFSIPFSFNHIKKI